jgi:hypothetical protein
MRGFISFFILTISIALSAPTANAEWDDRFGLVGPAAEFNNRIVNFWIEGSDLYVVGEFTTIDGAPASNVAKWDGSSWSTLGNPVFATNNGVYAITRYQGNIVVAGEFTTINGQPGDVAVWDGSSWSPLGNSTLYDGGNDDILALQVIGTDLYIGGRFSERVVRWDGTTTTPIVSSSTAPCCVAPRVWDLTSWNGDLIAAGIFLTFDGVTLNYVGRWDGSQWNAMDDGLPRTTTEAFVHDGDLYVQTSHDVYQWTGTQWISVTSDPASCQFANHSIYDALFYDGHLYRSGVSKVYSNNMSLFGVAKWTGVEWDDMRGGLDVGCGYETAPLAEYDGRLLVGGDFDMAGGMATSNRVSWNGSSWATNSPSDRVRAVMASGSDVYVGGDFVKAADLSAQHVAKWNGATWSALGGGVNGIVHDIVMIGGDLYAGGEFTDAGGSGAKYLARWDGAQWAPVSGEPLNGPVYALATDGTNLYVGGSFVAYIPSQSLLLLRVAKWDGVQWHALGDGVSDNSVRALVMDGSDLFIGGDFTKVGGIVTGNVAKWDGVAWSMLEFGFDDMVRSLAFFNGGLYAGGDFTRELATNEVVNHIARWDGAAWHPVGGTPPFGTDQPVRDLTSSAGGLFAVGEFATAGTVPAKHIARWTGSVWEAFEEGLNKPADAVAVSAGDVWVGGGFQMAGTVSSLSFAHWSTAPTAIDDAPTPRATTQLDAPYPNPFNPSTTIQYHVTDVTHVELAIFDVNGRRIRTLVDDVALDVGTQTVSWDGRDNDGRLMASGVYYVRLRMNQQSFSRKLVLLK